MGSTWNLHEIASKGALMISVFFLATAVRGDWLLFIVCLGQDYLREFLQTTDATLNSTLQTRGALERFYLKDLHIYTSFAVLVSFCTFWGIGLAFDTYFYKNRKDKPKEWKCQPDRWLTKTNEWHEFFLGSANMLVGSVISGFLSCYIMNGGKLELHINGTPPFTVREHPGRFIMLSKFLAIPIFTVPVHAVVYVVILVYGYYYGMMDHSGIKMDAIWPWQPSSLFHDDHHRYFHCNFGFNTILFDRFHGTLRRKNHKYGEKIFGGKGKADDNGSMESVYHKYL
ncbi:uncharacterized protein LOC132754475 [Ruditapes philippinarum]|uniref:uncharacterized protein LOC132754475 n=1 Tax=Ruditapes philippinarum TaxID=129788 RepID=UPI00295B76FC|nr:uncharacterized protein LOC132754475 [Ruditapes philippinarum]